MSAWTPEKKEAVRLRFADMRTDDLAAELVLSYSKVAQMAARLGVKKSAAYLAGPDAHRFDGKKGEGSRFAPRQRPWNAGVKGSTGTQEGCRATQFKKGRPASESANYVPIGSHRISKDGYPERKISDDPAIAPARRWVAVHRLVWESVNGLVPAGCVVVFKRGMKTTDIDLITADSVECITRVELMRRNSYHVNYPPELARVIQLTGALKRQINKRAEHEQQH